MNWVCKECTTEYAVDAPRCPHCGGTEHWDSFEYEELEMGKISKSGGLTDQVTGAGFSDDPDDERAAGTRVPENSNDPAQVEGLPVDDEGYTLTSDGERRLDDEGDGADTEPEDRGDLPVERDGTGEEMPPAEADEDGTGEEVPEPGRYGGWSKQDLQDEASRRGLSGAGTKADITTRLLAADEQEA